MVSFKQVGRDGTVRATPVAVPPPTFLGAVGAWPPVQFACVAILGIGGQLGTGFFIDKTRVLTAHHVVPDPSWLLTRDVVWGRIEGHSEKRLTVISADFVTSAEHDYTVFTVRAAPPKASLLALDEAGTPRTGQPVIVYGHQSGGVLRLSGADSSITYVEESGRLHYRADTFPGMSGGPVISAQTGELVALHQEADSGQSNLGLLAATIRQDLRR